ncbi:MAG: hypothetical protein QNJ19_09505 [Woeseiaceae bacterium]|nr:hypothetical protein [Woeseiaceae bacterium]
MSEPGLNQEESVLTRIQYSLLLPFLLIGCDATTKKTDAETPVLPADKADPITIVDAPLTGVSLGWGFSKSNNEPIPTICVEFVEGREPAQTKYMTMSEVSDSYELMQSLGMSAEASVKTMGYKAKGKAAYAKSVNITGFSSNFVLNAVVENGVVFAAPKPARSAVESGASGPRGGMSGQIRLTPEAARLANTPARFVERCGDSFVSAIYGGAKITAVLSIQQSSHSEQEKLSASMSGSGWGARFEGKVNAQSTSDSASNRMDLSMFQTGGSGDSIPVSKEQLLAKMDVLATEAMVAPKDFHIALTPYEVLFNWPDKEIPHPASEFDELASFWGAYNTLYDEIQAVLDAPDTFSLIGVDDNNCVSLSITDEDAKRAKLMELADAQDEILAGLKTMQDTAQTCVLTPSACSFNAADYRHPYAYRIQLPPPTGAVADLEEFVAYTLSDSVARRCMISPDNSGCISNAEIRNWSEKIGLTPLLESDPRYAKIEAAIADDGDARPAEELSAPLTEGGEAPAAAACAGSSQAMGFSREAGSNVLWFNSGHALFESVETPTEL